MFEIWPSKAEENLDKEKYASRPWDFATKTAHLKAQEVFERILGDLDRESKRKQLVVIGADTVIAHEGKIIGKPKTKDDAVAVLTSLSGKSHEVYTGISLIMEEPNYETRLKEFYASTRVEFDDLSDEVIRGYVETGEPMDKAGAYGIQAMGGSLIKGIQGDYYNVMGFPLNLFCTEMSRLILK